MTVHEQWLRGDFVKLIAVKAIAPARARYFEIYHIFWCNKQKLGWKKAFDKTIDECCTNRSSLNRAIKMCSK
jgi:hypothetical protein